MIKITDGQAELKVVKTRKEGKGEESKILGLDMTFACVTKAEGVTPDIFGNPSQVFWDDDEEKNPLFFGLKAITSDSKVKNATLQFAGNVFDHSATLSKWAFRPCAHGMIQLTFLASVSDPTRDQRIGVLAKLLKPGKLEVEGELNLLDQMNDDEPEAEHDDSQLEFD
tara:strand:+ start:145 stop:648 length:504 start_codon:yes stop_codon:yes gene_type:complete